MTDKPVIAFVAERSGTGKTTLLVKVLNLLKERGYRVGTVKHALHEIRLDREGTDSWRHAQAGADICVIAGKGVLASLRKVDEPSILDALKQASDGTDIVLAEGFKETPVRKIEVYREGHSRRLMCKETGGTCSGIVAVASNVPLDLSIPVLPLDDPVQVCNFIVEHFLNNKIET